MKIRYLLCVNRASHEAFVGRADVQHAEYTEQGVAGPCFTVSRIFDCEAEAREALAEELKCSAAEEGRYCCAHNPRRYDY